MFVYFIGMTKTKTKSTGSPILTTIHGNRNNVDEYRHPAFVLFEHLHDVYFFMKDKRSRFINANQPFIEMLGAHRLEDIYGKTDHDFTPKELSDRFVRDDRQVMISGKPIINRVELVPNADGSISWHTTSKVPLYDNKGKIIGLAGFTRDMSKASVSVKKYRTMSIVLDHITKNFAESITTDNLASLVHLSVSQFERKFKQMFQTTPMKYLVKYRINKACLMLVEDDKKITEIASLCGFYDHSHFIRQFTNAIGLSPADYRKQHQG